MKPERAVLTRSLTDHVAFRYTNYDTPFWVRENTLPRRWHTAGDGPTQYLSLVPAGAWAELCRAENLRTDEDAALVRMPIWLALIDQHGVADYSEFEKAEAAGFSAGALIDDDYTRCQVEGRRLRQSGFAGVLAPSAALPGAVNLTLFGPRLLSAWDKPPDLASSIPGCVVAVGGPPAGLASRVRHFGTQHDGLDQYRQRVFAEREEASTEPALDEQGGGDVESG